MTLGKSQSLQGYSTDPDAKKGMLPDALAHLSGQCAYPPPTSGLQALGAFIISLLFIRGSPAMSATSANSPLSGGSVLTRKPQRLTITVSWSVYQSLIDASDEQGRSISNMAAYWLERQSELG